MTAIKGTYTYKVIGDCEIGADVYAPAAPEPRPVVVWIHGGALIMGSRANLSEDQRDRYLRAGYAVVSIDYRLAPETKLPEIVEDLQDALRWVREAGQGLFGADTARIGVVGHSAGGYLALMSGLCVRPRPRAVVSFYGYGDIVGEWYSRPDPYYCQQPMVSSEEAHQGVGHGCPTATPTGEIAEEGRARFYLYCRQRGLWPREVSGHHPEGDPGFFRRFCPVANVTSDYPPALLLHGDRDTDVPYQQSVMVADALRAAGVEHELVSIPGGDHGFDRSPPAGGPDPWPLVMAFLRKHLA